MSACPRRENRLKLSIYCGHLPHSQPNKSFNPRVRKTKFPVQVVNKQAPVGMQRLVQVYPFRSSLILYMRNPLRKPGLLKQTSDLGHRFSTPNRASGSPIAVPLDDPSDRKKCDEALLDKSKRTMPARVSRRRDFMVQDVAFEPIVGCEYLAGHMTPSLVKRLARPNFWFRTSDVSGRKLGRVTVGPYSCAYCCNSSVHQRRIGHMHDQYHSVQGQPSKLELARRFVC
jgi:hypothetical protein